MIQSKCDLGLSAQRIYQDLTIEHVFTGSYYSVLVLSIAWSRPATSPSAASSAGPVMRPRLTLARAPPLWGPKASAGGRMSSASCCPTPARATVKSSIV